MPGGDWDGSTWEHWQRQLGGEGGGSGGSDCSRGIERGRGPKQADDDMSCMINSDG